MDRLKKPNRNLNPKPKDIFLVYVTYLKILI